MGKTVDLFEDMLVDVSEDLSQTLDAQLRNHLIVGSSGFAVFAGAGSGKTRTLVTLLQWCKSEFGKKLLINGRKIAVITFTNAACDEIKHRLGYDNSFSVSTIHSFAWDLIKYYQEDIKVCLTELLNEKIDRNSGKKAEKYKNRLSEIQSISSFTYNPFLNSAARTSLDHNEVIEITALLLERKNILQKIVIDSYPFLLIDECQDTQKELMNSFIKLQELYPKQFTLGLFGDMMQQIYSTGVRQLQKFLPKSFKVFTKNENYRSASRIVQLGNALRSDGIKQISKVEDDGGTARLFIVSSKKNQMEVEKEIAHSMAAITNDPDWKIDYESLVLEHQMAARRMNFSNLFAPLYSNSSLKLKIRDGKLPFFSLLEEVIFPLKDAYKSDNSLLVTKILRENSPLLALDDQTSSLSLYRIVSARARELVKGLMDLLSDKKVTCRQIFEYIAKNDLFKLDDDYLKQALILKDPSSFIKLNSEQKTIIEALNSTLEEYEAFLTYLQHRSKFFTHHGVKGLEFERVMVILDDDHAKWATMKYGKLIGTKNLSPQEAYKRDLGEETSLDTLARLFYVVCSRAKKSLAVVCYSDDVDRDRKAFSELGWFAKSEIVAVKN